MRQHILLLIGVIFCASTPLRSQQIINSTFGKGVSVLAQDSSFSMTFNARVQSLFATEFAADDISGLETNWLIRRSRLKFGGFAHNPNIQYKIELGLSNRDHGTETPETGNTSNLILDAFVRWKVAGNFEIWVGQTKLPGNRERVISSQKLQFVDRSLVNSRFNIDRDMGIQFHNSHTFGQVKVKEAFAISQGEGRNRTVGNQGGLEYTGRIEVLPMGSFTGKGDYFGSDLKREETPKLSIGITYDYNGDAPRERGNLGNYVADTAYNSLETIFGDFMFKWNGWSVAGEYANKQALGERIIDFSDGSFVSNYFTGYGTTIQAGYLLQNNVEPAFRYTQISPEIGSGRNIETMYTLGVSKYVVGHSLKIQSDLSWIDKQDQITLESSQDVMFRFQVEMAF